MNQHYSNSELFAWAEEMEHARPSFADGTMAELFHEELADMGDEIWEYLEGDYVDGLPAAPNIFLSILELVTTGGQCLEVDDPRLLLIHLWQALADAYGTLHAPDDQALAEASLILGADVLLNQAPTLPEAETYGRIVPLEFINFDWRTVKRCDPAVTDRLRLLYLQVQEDLEGWIRAAPLDQPPLFTMDVSGHVEVEEL